MFNIHNTTFEEISDESNITAKGKFNISNTFLGYNNITFTMYDANNQVRISNTHPERVLKVFTQTPKLQIYKKDDVAK